MFGTKSVDSIISGVTKMLNDLEKASAWAELKAGVHAEEIRVAQEAQRVWNVERLRAEKFKEKIKAFIA